MTTLPILTTLAAASVVLAACAKRSPPETGRADPQVAEEVSRLREATRPFHELDAAAAAGYAREVRDCLVHEHHGAMGYHHVNRGYVDENVELERPEILLYERRPDGGYRLNGVEFIVPYTARPREAAPPVLMRRQLQRDDNLKIWYLHVWAWRENPDGIFANFHPDVTCPASARKVFVPFEDKSPH